jgi:hypothetical protein
MQLTPEWGVEPSLESGWGINRCVGRGITCAEELALSLARRWSDKTRPEKVEGMGSSRGCQGNTESGRGQETEIGRGRAVKLNNGGWWLDGEVEVEIGGGALASRMYGIVDTRRDLLGAEPQTARRTKILAVTLDPATLRPFYSTRSTLPSLPILYSMPRGDGLMDKTAYRDGIYHPP